MSTLNEIITRGHIITALLIIIFALLHLFFGKTSPLNQGKK